MTRRFRRLLEDCIEESCTQIKDDPSLAQRMADFLAWFRALALPRWLGAVETWRRLILVFIVLCVSPLAISVLVDLRRGIALSEPESLGALGVHMFLVGFSGVLEEAVFRGFPKKYLGNGGLVLGTLVWVILHQFYAVVPTIYRLPADMLHGVFYIKLWRGRLWWLAPAIHLLWNISIAGGWQIVKMVNT